MLRQVRRRAWFLLVVALPVSASISVKDDIERDVTLSQPARRVVSLAPHTTELLFSIGAGDRVVGTVEYSDYPSDAKKIPQIGSSAGIDVERIVLLKPDLVIAWSSGNPRHTIEQLDRLGFPVYLTEPRRLADIARTIRHLGRLVDTVSEADKTAERFTLRHRALATKFSNRPLLRVFYQVVDPLLVTVNGEHLISEILRLCGGENIFSNVPVIAPVVTEEAVLEENPDVIIAGGTEAGWRPWQVRWASRTGLAATKRDALYLVPADLLHRHSPRILEGAERVCVSLDDARRKHAPVAKPIVTSPRAPAVSKEPQVSVPSR